MSHGSRPTARIWVVSCTSPSTTKSTPLHAHRISTKSLKHKRKVGGDASRCGGVCVELGARGHVGSCWARCVAKQPPRWGVPAVRPHERCAMHLGPSVLVPLYLARHAGSGRVDRRRRAHFGSLCRVVAVSCVDMCTQAPRVSPSPQPRPAGLTLFYFHFVCVIWSCCSCA